MGKKNKGKLEEGSKTLQDLLHGVAKGRGGGGGGGGKGKEIRERMDKK